MPSTIAAATATAAAAVLLRAAPALASMLPPTCPPDTRAVNFLRPSDDADCYLCVGPAAPGEDLLEGECFPVCDEGAAECAASPPGCGAVVCPPKPYAPPPRAEDCPDEKPERDDACSFKSNCAYPETYDPYCSFDCLGGRVAQLCMGGPDDLPPPQPEPPVLSGDHCAAQSSCAACLAKEGCDAWNNAGRCYATCADAPMDGSCWSTEVSPDDSIEEICRSAEDQAADDALCASQKDCASCLGAATTSEGGTGCQWFEEEGMYCQNGCGIYGCGAIGCPADDAGVGEEGMGGVGMTNPVSQFCIENGGKPDVLAGVDGSLARVCVFGDGSACEEYEYFEGECAPGDGWTGPDEDAGMGMGMIGMANPASVNCVEKGGTSEPRTGEDGGEYGVCVFGDGSECEEWAYFRGECAKGDSLSYEDPGEEADEGTDEGKDEDPNEEMDKEMDEDTDGGNTDEGTTGEDPGEDTDEGTDEDAGEGPGKGAGEDPVDDADEGTDEDADKASPDASPEDGGSEDGDPEPLEEEGDPEPLEESSASGKDVFLPSFACASVVGMVSFAFA